MTLTSKKRARRPVHYLAKNQRTMVYRALYGTPSVPDKQGLPELNETRKMPEGWSFIRVEQVFHSLAETVTEAKVVVSNGLFTPTRYQELLQRMERLRMLDKINRAKSAH